MPTAYFFIFFSFNYLCIITWHKPSFYTANSNKLLRLHRIKYLWSYHNLHHMQKKKKKKSTVWQQSFQSRDTRWSAKQHGHYVISEGRGWQWRSYGYKQLSHYQLKALKTRKLRKVFFLGTAKWTNDCPPYIKLTTYIKFQCKVKLQTKKNEPGLKCGGSLPQTPEEGRRYQQHHASHSKKEEETCTMNTIPLWAHDKHADSLLIPSPPTQNLSQPPWGSPTLW